VHEILLLILIVLFILFLVVIFLLILLFFGYLSCPLSRRSCLPVNRRLTDLERGEFREKKILRFFRNLARKKWPLRGRSSIPTRRASFDVALFLTEFTTRPGIPWGSCYG
jgi:hypothetical protein